MVRLRPDPIPGNNSVGHSLAGSRRAKRVGPLAAMILGFCALLILMTLLAFDSIHALRELEASSASVRQRYLVRERTLREIRFSLYESGNLLREFALVDPNAETRESYLAQLHAIRDRASVTMQRALRLSPHDGQDPLRKLASELETYWLTVERNITDHTHRNNKGLLQGDALAQRAAVLAITSEVSGVNEVELRQAELDISKVFERSRARLQNFAASAISISLLLAVSSILYLSRLENRADEKYRESLQYQRELKELSKRLVDAQEEERRAISRELHDQIAQTLAALLINVRELIDNPQALEASGNGLHKVRLLAEDCLNKVRNTALLLRPSMLDDLGLVAAVEWQAREVSKRTGLVVEVVDTDFHDDLPEEYKTCIYRVVQEALNNCTAHAKAGRARVVLREDSEHCVLSIEDDGAGFDSGRKRGLGLLGMHERVARLSGTFLIDSAPGKGTSIRIELPLAHASQTADQRS